MAEGPLEGAHRRRDAPEHLECLPCSALTGVDLGEAQVGPDEAGLQPDRLLEKLGAFAQSVLLKTNGAQDRPRDRSRLGVGEGQPGLLLGLVQPPLADQTGGPLQGFVRLRDQRDARKQDDEQQGGG